MGRGERALPHLYVHVPFCAHRCGYCDFVTVTGAEDLRGRYVDALIAELRGLPAGPVETVFVGGGTPSLLDDDLLARLLAALPASGELTVECNPETITATKARVLGRGWSHARLAGRPELPAAPARNPRAAGEPGNGSGSGLDAPCGRASKTSTST